MACKAIKTIDRKNKRMRTLNGKTEKRVLINNHWVRLSAVSNVGELIAVHKLLTMNIVKPRKN